MRTIGRSSTTFGSLGNVLWLVVGSYIKPLGTSVLALSLFGAPAGCTSKSDSVNESDSSDDDDDRSDDDNNNETTDDNEDTSDSEDEDEDAEGSGDFGAIWRQKSAEVVVIDMANPIPETVNVEIPSSLPFPESDREVELFEQFKDGQHLTYAWVQGAPDYYRITAQTIGSDDAYVVQQGDSVRTFAMEHGNLYSITSLAIEATIIQSYTRYAEYKGTFPPDEWPSNVVDATIGEVQ